MAMDLQQCPPNMGIGGIRPPQKRNIAAFVPRPQAVGNLGIPITGAEMLKPQPALFAAFFGLRPMNP
jgi:hypothetical protein